MSNEAGPRGGPASLSCIDDQLGNVHCWLALSAHVQI